MKKLYHYFLKANRYLRRGKRNPVALRLVTDNTFKPKIIPSKKIYNRKNKNNLYNEE